MTSAERELLLLLGNYVLQLETGGLALLAGDGPVPASHHAAPLRALIEQIKREAPPS